MRLDDYAADRIRVRDFICKCDDPACTHKHYDPLTHPRTHALLRRVGDLLRDYELGFKISSGFRCPTHNLEVGGAPDSGHVHRCALDIRTDGPPYELALLAEAQGWYSGLLVYPWGIHLDIHPNDRVVRGHSYGPKDNRFIRFGTRRGLKMPDVFAWNLDEDCDIPAYVAEAQSRERVDA